MNISPPAHPTQYERIGGAEKVHALVDRFYQWMDELPEASRARRLHPVNLERPREKLFKFLSGWFGGPQLYVQEYGSPMMRKRHLRFPIGDAERDQWMLCMNRALDEVVEDARLRAELSAAFVKIADHMRNM